MRSVGAVVFGFLMIAVGLFALGELILEVQNPRYYTFSVNLFLVFLGLWITGALLVVYGGTRTNGEELPREFEQKTSESKLVPTVRVQPDWNEVVMKIECPYCGFLYDETLNKCPQCGGRR